MTSSWQTETGRLACHWCDAGQNAQYNPHWMEEISEIQSSYSPPLTVFTSRSPFGGATWFQPHPANPGRE